MNRHFHYYAIRAIAKQAGFNEAEAETLAYASQYVDDATEHKGIPIAKAPPEADDQHIAGLFEPVCTAHAGIQYLAAGKKDVQRKVYIPFHFVPAKAYNGNGPFDYRVAPGGEFALALLELGLGAIRDTQDIDGTPRLRALIKTGIALHSYADTWSHQRFSGRRSPEDNDIQDRERWEKGEFRGLGFFERAVLDAMLDIGHAEAATMPDVSSLRWRYKHDDSGQVYDRNNTDDFTTAAMDILGHLCAATGTTAPDIEARVHAALLDDKNSLRSWSSQFPDAFATDPKTYDPKRWRREALDGNHDWDKFEDAADFAGLFLKYAGDLKWFLFHVEAGKQRDYVVRRIRQDLR
jgi:hypothetical protein